MYNRYINRAKRHCLLCLYLRNTSPSSRSQQTFMLNKGDEEMVLWKMSVNYTFPGGQVFPHVCFLVSLYHHQIQYIRNEFGIYHWVWPPLHLYIWKVVSSPKLTVLKILLHIFLLIENRFFSYSMLWSWFSLPQLLPDPSHFLTHRNPHLYPLEKK